MVTPTLIRRLLVEPLTIALKKPFGIAGGAQVRAENVLVTVELVDGTRGYGEAAPFPAFNGETQAGAIAAVNAARPAVEGADVRSYRAIAAAIRPLVGGAGSARCALETAVLDALTKHAGLPLWAFFGGAERSLSTDVTITVGSIAEARDEATAFTKQGFSRLKVKIGAGSFLDDLARVTAIHEAAPRAGLILDGNGGLSAKAAIHLVEALDALGIKPILLEQPVPGDDWEGLVEVSRKAGIPVAADESAATAADARRIAETGAAQVINIKLMKSGVIEALAIAEVARASGIALMIGGMVEATLAMSMSACFAAGLGGFAFVDLDTPLFLAEEPFSGGYALLGERMDLEPITRGHGVIPIDAEAA
jgi:L-alanine-DL-glutamate epimerase-like enolase superfamily enzyme